MESLEAAVGRNPQSARFEIDCVEATLPPEEFVARYYLPQVPVVVTGIARYWPATRLWSPEYVLAKLKDAAIARAVSFDVVGDQLTRDCEAPSFFNYIKSRYPVIGRPAWARVWISRKGTHTRWHYDGNSLQVLNVQVRGRKRFSLISPQTPLACLAFLNGARVAYAELSEIDTPIRFAACEIEAGDMIFIPQHWYHYVVSLDDENLNVNWVWTDTELLKTSHTPTAIRERENIAALFLLGTWLRRVGRSPAWLEYLKTYGGTTNFELTRELYKSVSAVAIAKRCLLELTRTLGDARCERVNLGRELALHDGVRRNPYDYFPKAESPPTSRR